MKGMLFPFFLTRYRPAILLFAAILALSGYTQAQTFDPFPPSPIPDRIILNWKTDPATSQAVTWRTDTSVSIAYGEIAFASASPDFQLRTTVVKAETQVYISDRGKSHYHSVNFTGLSPHTKYAYRVGDSTHWSEWFHFHTATFESSPFSFLYFGDAQNEVKSLWSRTIRQAYSTLPKADFMIHAGDLINQSENDHEWGEWFHAAGWINGMIPSILTPGNHEYFREKGSVERNNLTTHWHPSFTLPENGPEGLEETVYYLDYQGARIISLNSQEMFVKEESLTTQKKWLENVLDDNKQKWTIVTHHHPVFPTRTGMDEPLLRDSLKPLYDKHGVDLVLQGHDHTYARGGNFPFGQKIRSQSGPVYVVSVSGPKMYDSGMGRWIERLATNTQLYQVIEVKGDSLEYKAYTTTGELYDAFLLMKQPDGTNLFVDQAPDTPEIVEIPAKLEEEWKDMQAEHFHERFRRYKARLEGMKTEPVDLVNPLIDAANSRWFFFSSACRPFGMVNLSPDNLVEGTWGTGYRYNTDTIRGFSHIHAWQLSGVSVMPLTGEIDPREGPNGYMSSFSHDKEVVKPGYDQVYLERYGINVELTSTTRVGFHRYTYDQPGDQKILFNLGGNLGPAKMVDGGIRQVSPMEVEGYTVNGKTRRRPKEAPVYFVARFDHPIKSAEAWKGKKTSRKLKNVLGPDCGAIFTFQTGSNQPILMKVGISYVSIEQARLNLETEIEDWDFDRVVAESRLDWNQWLGKIDVEGGTYSERSRFYTDLWHALQGRRIISDVNGKYVDMTGDSVRIGQIPLDNEGNPKFNHYNSDSFWGAQWTLNTLWHLAYPKVTEEFCNSMLMMYQDGGLIPRGPSGGNYTYVMTGASTTPFFVSAYMKGIRGFDIEKAYEGLRKNHLPGGIMAKSGYEHRTFKGGGIEHYIDKGFVPYPLFKNGKRYGFHEDGGGQTLEYAYQDWCLAQMAKALGKDADYDEFINRAENYKNLYDPTSGWMRPKTLDGEWFSPFDPIKYDDGWVEATAAASTWFVPHDPEGLIRLMGGRRPFVRKLNRSFEMAREHNFVNTDKQEGRNRYINYGNQPSMQTAHLFNYAGAPWLTQYWTREIIDHVYSGTDPFSGYSGDEDQGLMGSLAVLLKIGLFSMRGGAATEPVYEIGSPIFDRITIHLDQRYYSGEEFIIETINNSHKNLYIQSVVMDGMTLDKPWMYHKDVVDGGRLILNMGPEPNKKWGRAPWLSPPSMTKRKVYSPNEN